MKQQEYLVDDRRIVCGQRRHGDGAQPAGCVAGLMSFSRRWARCWTRVETVNPLQATQVMLLESALLSRLAARGRGGHHPRNHPGAVHFLRYHRASEDGLRHGAMGVAGVGGYPGRALSLATMAECEPGAGAGYRSTDATPVVRDSGMQQFPETVAFDDDVIEHPLAVPSARQVAPLPVQEAVLYEEVDDFDDELFDEDFDLEAPATEDDEAETEGEVVLPGVEPPVPTAGPGAGASREGGRCGRRRSTGGSPRSASISPQYDMGISDYDEAFDIFDDEWSLYRPVRLWSWWIRSARRMTRPRLCRYGCGIQTTLTRRSRC